VLLGSGIATRPSRPISLRLSFSNHFMFRFNTPGSLSAICVFSATVIWRAPLLYRTISATVIAEQSGRIAEIDCWGIAPIAKRAGAPANPSAGVKLYKNVGAIVTLNEPIFEIHESDSQLHAALEYSRALRHLIRYEEDL
jgi:hypothetical protein